MEKDSYLDLLCRGILQLCNCRVDVWVAIIQTLWIHFLILKLTVPSICLQLSVESGSPLLRDYLWFDLRCPRVYPDPVLEYLRKQILLICVAFSVGLGLAVPHAHQIPRLFGSGFTVSSLWKRLSMKEPNEVPSAPSLYCRSICCNGNMIRVQFVWILIQIVLCIQIKVSFI